jgi:hypothetical protein
VLGMGTKNISNMAIAFGDESTFQPHRFLWIKQGLVPNFFHIFHPDAPLHKLDE